MDVATRLLIVRHGQTTYNRDHRFDGQLDTGLTMLGQEQALALGSRLMDFNIDIIYTSPLKRARETAGYIADFQQNNTGVIVEDRLKEIDCGDCTGMTRSAIYRDFPNMVEEWSCNTDPPFPGGESLRDVGARCLPLVEDILYNHRHKTILISGHGSLNKAIIGSFLQIPYGLRFKLQQDNCCLNRLDFFDTGSFKVQLING